MKYQTLNTIIETLTSKTSALSTTDFKEGFLASDFIKKAIEISTTTLKEYKKFAASVDVPDLAKYVMREFDTMLATDQKAVKTALEFCSGKHVVNLPQNIVLSYNDIKNKTENYQQFYNDTLNGIKAETERNAKDIVLNNLYDLKSSLQTVQDRLENYDNKIADAF